MRVQVIHLDYSFEALSICTHEISKNQAKLESRPFAVKFTVDVIKAFARKLPIKTNVTNFSPVPFSEIRSGLFNKAKIEILLFTKPNQ